MKKVIRASRSTDDMLNAFESRIQELQPEAVESSTVIEAAWYDDDEEDTEGWVFVQRKTVMDHDGFTTDYTLWYNENSDEWCTVFGDKDLYHPWDHYHDMDFESNESEARDWFDNYQTDEDHD